jgi:hypothetical protein
VENSLLVRESLEATLFVFILLRRAKDCNGQV